VPIRGPLRRPFFRLRGEEGPSLLELLQQALSSTTGGYDRLAPKFEATPFRTPDALLAPPLERAAAAGVEAALDLGCGTGAALRMLKPHARVLVGLDLSEGMLAEAARRLEAAPGEALVSLRVGDMLDPPADLLGRFDLVTSFGAFGHVLEEDEPRLVDAAWRLLGPGGRFVFVTGTRPPRTSPARWLAHGFNAAMRVRNALWKPPFVMYYLTFLLPRAEALLRARGFELRVYRDFGARGLVSVEARRPSDA